VAFSKCSQKKNATTAKVTKKTMLTSPRATKYKVASHYNTYIHTPIRYAPDFFPRHRQGKKTTEKKIMIGGILKYHRMKQQQQQQQQ
jgi:hypothetical protein